MQKLRGYDDLGVGDADAGGSVVWAGLSGARFVGGPAWCGLVVEVSDNAKFGAFDWLLHTGSFVSAATMVIDSANRCWSTQTRNLAVYPSQKAMHRSTPRYPRFILKRSDAPIWV